MVTLSGYAHTGGSPWGACWARDGAIYVTQGGNVPGQRRHRRRSAASRACDADGTVELISSEIAGHDAGRSQRPGLRSGRPSLLHRLGNRARPASRPRRPGPAVRARRLRSGEFLHGAARRSIPTGSPSTPTARLYWTESMAHRVCRLADGEATVFCQLTDNHVPDGMAFARGRPAVRVHDDLRRRHRPSRPRARSWRRSSSASIATNCIFDGSTLYVTASHGRRSPRTRDVTGTFWRVETDATGLPLLPGQLRARRPGPCDAAESSHDPRGVRERDLVGYGRTPPRVRAGPMTRASSSTWCSSTRRAPSTRCCGATIATTAGASTPSRASQPPQRDRGTESHYEYGSRAGRVAAGADLRRRRRAGDRLGERRRARAQPGASPQWMREHDHDLLGHGWRWIEHWTHVARGGARRSLRARSRPTSASSARRPARLELPQLAEREHRASC